MLKGLWILQHVLINLLFFGYLESLRLTVKIYSSKVCLIFLYNSRFRYFPLRWMVSYICIEMYVSLQGNHVQFRRKSKQLVNFHQNVPGINFMIIPLAVHEFKDTTDRYVNCECFHGRYITKTKHNSLICYKMLYVWVCCFLRICAIFASLSSYVQWSQLTWLCLRCPLSCNFSFVLQRITKDSISSHITQSTRKHNNWLLKHNSVRVFMHLELQPDCSNSFPSHRAVSPYRQLFSFCRCHCCAYIYEKFNLTSLNSLTWPPGLFPSARKQKITNKLKFKPSRNIFTTVLQYLRQNNIF
jgi:hypothetical protein